MPGELKPLVRGWQHERRDGVDVWRWKFDEGEWVAACAGAGVDAATRAFAAAEKDGVLTAVISTGWAGALTEDLESGRAYAVSGVIDVRTGERFEAVRPAHPGDNNRDVARVGHPDFNLPRFQNRDRGHPELILVTSPRVADEVEKQRQATAYGADLVDMEASAIARLAQMRGIPFYCVKGISDGFTDKLPDFNRFIRPDGRFDMTGMVLFSILRPWHWPSLMRMGENSKKASQSMREVLLNLLDERATIRERNGYPDLKH
jgi:adenosylhomocysteine nucleosidase